MTTLRILAGAPAKSIGGRRLRNSATALGCFFFLGMPGNWMLSEEPLSIASVFVPNEARVVSNNASLLFGFRWTG